MRVLAIETAADRGGAALLVEDGPVYEAVFHAPRAHGEKLPGCVAGVLGTAGLGPGEVDLVVVDVGPGSFTGIRVGMAFAKAFAQASDVPLVGVRQSEVVGLPIAAWWPGRVAVWIHDRRDFVYHAWAGGNRVGQETVLHAAGAAERLRGKERVLVVGTGALVFARLIDGVGAMAAVDSRLAYPSPAELARLGLERYRRTGADEEVEPLYIQPALANEKEA